MTRKFALKSRTAAGEIDFAADLNEEQLAVATAPGGPMLVRRRDVPFVDHGQSSP